MNLAFSLFTPSAISAKFHEISAEYMRVRQELANERRLRKELEDNLKQAEKNAKRVKESTTLTAD